ncbi:MAG: hypothetical protein LHV68_08490 [Elusimicrobia bacterium]|nr:hypothetical protein [Candidatus Liberimonas magnetica]
MSHVIKKYQGLMLLILVMAMTGCSRTLQNFIGHEGAGYGVQTEQKTEQPIKDIKNENSPK